MTVENSDLVQGVLSSLTAEAEEHPEIHQYEIDSTSGNEEHCLKSNFNWNQFKLSMQHKYMYMYMHQTMENFHLAIFGKI